MQTTEIKNRVGDALFLWKGDRMVGALMVALIAFAAVAKRRYPSLGDRERFECLFRDYFPMTLSIEYKGKLEPIEHIFYKFLRCNLVHDGSLPIDIEFIDNNTNSMRAGGAPHYVLLVGGGWFDRAIEIVEEELVNNP